MIEKSQWTKERRAEMQNQKKKEKTVAFFTLGCKVNAYETAGMEQLFQESGYTLVPFQEKADVYVIHTCSVTNIAERKSRQMWHQARKRNPEAIVVAVGCYVQAAKETLLEDPALDLIIGTNRKQFILQEVEAYQEKRQRSKNIIADIRKDQLFETCHVTAMQEKNRAFLKIQDGCNQFCSYCIIPYTRGNIRSRKESDVIEEIKYLQQNGYQEVVLTGIHLSSYGKDFGKEPQNALLQLLQRIEEIDGIQRIRLGSLEPGIITEEFVLQLSKIDKICCQFHLSLQSGCDATLKRMHRRYTTKEYQEKCKIIRKHFPNAALTTDIIVGFPGETEAEFMETVAFLQKIAFSRLHIFPYSKRNGTLAAEMKQQVPEQEKKRRSHILQNWNQIWKEQYQKQLIGKEVSILLEEEMEINGKRYQVGYAKEYVRVAVLEKENMKNQIICRTVSDILTEEILFAQ